MHVLMSQLTKLGRTDAYAIANKVKVTSVAKQLRCCEQHLDGGVPYVYDRYIERGRGITCFFNLAIYGFGG